MDLFIGFTLVLDVTTYHFLIAVLAYRIDIVPLCTELTTPEFLLHLGMSLEDMLSNDALCDLDDATRCVLRDGLD